MNRRESLKSLLIGSIAGGLIINGCAPAVEETAVALPEKSDGYGRTPKEKALDLKLSQAKFFTDHELETIAVLCDLILPATTGQGSATDAAVPEFIEFIAKDIPNHKLPLRGGIMWLDNRSNRKYGSEFILCNQTYQKELLDEIAYPAKAQPEVGQGVKFFSLMRDLTLTGYYTTKMGIDDLGYVGNSPNVWDGVPEEILKEHGLEYDQEWLSKCIDQNTRNEIATWDDEGNLIS